MTMKPCCTFGREYEKPNFCRYVKSINQQLKTGREAKCSKCEKI